MQINTDTPAVAIVDQLSRASAEVAIERQEVAQSGNVPPPQETDPATAEQVVAATAEIADYVQNFSRALQFQVDDVTGSTVVTVTDRETEEIVRQIPSEEIIAIARYIAEYGYDPVKGLLMDDNT